MHNTPPLPAAPSNSSVGNDAPIAPYAPHPMSRTRRAGCPHPAARYAPHRLPKTVIARSAATWQSVFPSRRVRSLCFRRRRRLPTVVPADSRSLSWPPIGALPRNRFASPATGGASPISPTPRIRRTSNLVIARSEATWQSVLPQHKNRPANPAGRSHFLRNMYSLSCPCDAATPAPDPSRTSASCSPPPARHSGGTAHSTSQR